MQSSRKCRRKTELESDAIEQEMDRNCEMFSLLMLTN